MASDRDQHDVPRGPLSDDADTLEALRRVWLAHDDGSDADAILAATQPIESAQQEQIVQRLLQASLARPRARFDESERERAPHSPQSRAPALFHTPAPLLRRTPLWSVAAACALCCWLTARAPLVVFSGREAATTKHRATDAQRPVLPLSTSRATRAKALAEDPAAFARGGQAHAELAETYARRQRFEEAEALRAFAMDPPFAVF